MKTWKKVLFNVLGCGLFLFVGGIILGVIIEDNELAYSICLKIVLGYVFILSFISFIKKVEETMQNINKEKVKAILTTITWAITTLPYITLWGILVAFAFTKYLSIGLTVAFVSLAIYILLLLIIGSKMQHEEYKESDKKEVDDLEQYVKNKDKE